MAQVINKYSLKTAKDARVIFEAAELTSENAAEVRDWCGGGIVKEHDMETNEPMVGINVQGPREVFRVSEGEVLIKFEGQFFKSNLARFRALYRPVEG